MSAVKTKRSSARASGKSLESVVNQANKWRDQLNPLRMLTLERAVALFEARGRGDLADLMWTYHAIEETDPDLMALIERRTSAIKQLDWNIKVSDKRITSRELARLADEQETALYKFYEKLGNLTDFIEHLAMASFRGYAIAQPQRGGAVDLAEPDMIELLDPWLFARDGYFGPWHWNPEAKSSLAKSDETLIDPATVVIREVWRPINRFALFKFIRSNLSEKDWDGFVEIYGLNGCIVIGPPDMTDEQKIDFAIAADRIGPGGSGSLPHGSDVKFPDAMRGVAPFKPRLDHLSEKLILAGTGGRLTMLSAPGSGTLAGGAHQETFEIIARSEAKAISDTLNRQLDARILEAAFPGQPVLAYFDLAAKEEQDVGEVIDHAVKLAQAGIQIDLGDLAERTGYKLALKPQPAAMPGMGLTLNRAAAADDAIEAAAARRQAVLDDVLAEIEAAGEAAESEQDFLKKADEIIASLPARLPDLAAEDALALGDRMLAAALGEVEPKPAKEAKP